MTSYTRDHSWVCPDCGEHYRKREVNWRFPTCHLCGARLEWDGGDDEYHPPEERGLME